MRILHFSDVHINVNNLEFTRKQIRKMLNSILNHYNQKPSIDLVVFSGDMIMSGGVDNKGNNIFTLADGFHTFKDEVIVPICTTLKLPIDHFILTMGNHDADWKQANDDIKNEINKSKNSLEILTLYNKYINSNNAPWICDFNSLRDSLYSESNYSKNNGFANLILSLDGKKVGISMLNSAWGTIPNSQHVLLNQDQIVDSMEYLNQEHCDYKICVMHNPCSCFCEDEQKCIRNLLLQNYDVCFTGHTHQQEDYAMMRREDTCYFSTAPKFRSLECDMAENDNRYLNGFIIFDDDSINYSITRVTFENRQYVIH